MVTTPTPPRNVLAGKVLLGWMDRDTAVNFLTKDCVLDQALTESEAEHKWRDYRDRAEALPERDALEPQRLQLNATEQAHAHRFLSFMHQIGARDVQEVIKVDLSKLVVHQYLVVTDRSEGYKLKCATSD